MSLIRRLPKKAKRSTRWRSQKHLTFVRGHACVMCDAGAPIEAAHIRMGSGAGMAQKPHDYLAVALCADCHRKQHSMSERDFWKGSNLDAILDAFQRTSPCRREIQEHKGDVL
jgi:hypothetical protein